MMVMRIQEVFKRIIFHCEMGVVVSILRDHLRRRFAVLECF